MKPWRAMAGEPAEAYERFVEYCTLGPGRTLALLWQQTASTGSTVGDEIPASWVALASRFEWERRSAAWDSADSSHRQEIAHLRDAAERRIRLRYIQRGLTLGIRLLDAAGLDAIEADEARALAPMARQLVRDMLAAQRAESAAHFAESERKEVVYSADDFVAAERRAREALGLTFPSGRDDRDAGSLEQAVEATATSRTSPRLLVCVGDDPALEVDLAMLRGVRARAGLAFHALHRVSRASFARSLRRAREVGRPVRFVHLSCHASALGVEFVDGIADGAWLSARLEGVQVLIIAACRGDEVGDWLRVVPYVITFADDLPHADAATLTFTFWEAIAFGASPASALESALIASSPEVGEYVVRHW
jgi:hypothetical protein